MITVIGSSNTDFTIKTPYLPRVGETLSGKDFFMAQGGKGANQAAQIAKLKRPVSFIGNIGNDIFGDKSVANLKKLGVNTKFVFRDKHHKSGMAFIVVDEKGRNMIIVSPGSNHHFKIKDLLKAKKLIEKSKIILLQLEIPYEIIKKSIDIAYRKGVKVILNPAPYRVYLSKDILSKVYILTPNEVEIGAMTGIKGRSDNSMRKAGRILLKRGIKHVVVTRGRKGACVIDKQGFRSFKPMKVSPVDTTCAGDSFSATLAAAIYNGKTIDEAIKVANMSAAITVTRMCAQSSLPCLKELKKLYF